MPSLTLREREVLQAIANGFTRPQTGRLMGISLSTVNDHLKRINLKLGGRNGAHMVSIAYQHGILTVEDKA